MLAGCTLLLMLSSAAPATGADFFYLDHDAFTGKFTAAPGPLVLSGGIEPGDYDRLLAKILDDEARFLARDELVLASSAGDPREAMRIAGLLGSLHTSVSVGPVTGRCRDACFLVFAAADQRATIGTGMLGLEGLDASGRAAVAGVRQFLRDHQVSEQIAAYVLRSPAAVHWLSPDEEAALGPRSAAFTRYLRARCAWDDGLERAVLAGKRPVADLQPFWDCRSRTTRRDARERLRTLRKVRSVLPGG